MKYLRLVMLMLATASPAFAGEIVVQVEGMTCISCAQALSATFDERAEVKAVDIDVEKGTVRLTMKDGQSLDDDSITRLIDKAGYTATSIKKQP